MNKNQASAHELKLIVLKYLFEWMNASNLCSFDANLEISNLTLIMKKSNPSTQGILWVQHNQAVKLQWSIRSKTEVKENEPKARIQTNKDLKKYNLKSWVVCSQPSKLLTFCSCQIYYIKQCGTTFQMVMFWWWSNWPYQEASISRTHCGITHWTPNNPNTIFHNSAAINFPQSPHYIYT